MSPIRLPGPRASKGFTLIEVLVALLIFSFGLLGFVGLQARSVQMSTDAENRNRAAALANELAAVAQLNTNSGTINIPTAQYNSWVARVATPASGGMPGGVGSATATSSANVMTVTITWPAAGAAAGAQSGTYTTQIVTNP